MTDWLPGTTSMLSNLDYDCMPPRNINDLEMHPDVNELPQSHFVAHFTDTTFLHMSMQTFELRARLCSMTNSLKGGLEFKDILRYEDALQHCLDGIPHWANSKSIQVRALLDLQLRQIIVVLYTPIALQPGLRKKSDCRYAIIASLEAAAKSIQIHSNLIEALNYSLCLTRNDYFRAALLICHVTYYAREAKGTTSSHTTKWWLTVVDSVMMQVAKTIFDDTLHKALRLQETRAMQPGRGSEYFWYVSAAISLIGVQFDPSKSETLNRQAVDRVSKLLYKVLSLHDEPNEWTLASEVRTLL
jgi:hypothetical protein